MTIQQEAYKLIDSLSEDSVLIGKIDPDTGEMVSTDGRGNRRK